MSDSIFPLRLSLFERYMLLDDLAGNSMTMPLSFRFEGCFDHETLEAAYDEARMAHPLFRCKISVRDHCWHPVSEWDGIVWLGGEDVVFPWDEQRIDITRCPGLRFAVHENAGSTTFHFLFHHEISDGLGFFRFLNTLFTAYCRRQGRDMPEETVREENLLLRESYELEPLPHPLPWHVVLRDTVRESLRWALAKPVSLFSRNPCGGFRGKSFDRISKTVAGETVLVEARRWNDDGYLHVELNPASTERLLARCKSEGRTVGAFLLSQLFLSLAAAPSLTFSPENAKTGKNDLVRIGMVYNMRGKTDRGIPACNMISYAFPSRRTGECRPEPAFFDGVAGELDTIRKWHVETMFLTGLKVASKIPLLLRRIVRSRRCLATAMFSSMNRLETLFSPELSRDEQGRIVVGEATLYDIRATIPCRRGTNLSTTTAGYAGSLIFSVRYDAGKIDSEAAVNWLVDWLEHLIS